MASQDCLHHLPHVSVPIILCRFAVKQLIRAVRSAVLELCYTSYVYISECRRLCHGGTAVQPQIGRKRVELMIVGFTLVLYAQPLYDPFWNNRITDEFSHRLDPLRLQQITDIQ